MSKFHSDNAIQSFLVVPSNRQERLSEFLEAWAEPIRSHSIRTIVVEDNPEPSFKVKVDHHVAWSDVERTLGDDAWIISRRDSAIRSYGFLLAHQLGADITYTLDDDCRPQAGENFFEGHVAKLYRSKQWIESVPGMRTRGIPYDDLGRMDSVLLSVGLWTGVPDLDSIQSFAEPVPDEFMPPENCDRILPYGQFAPLCGMNMAFRRKAAPLMYFPLMGLGQPYARFDDIWFGVICKHVCDHLGLSIAMGHPFIHHSRASNKFVNLIKEAPGIVANENFWRHMAKAKLSETTPAGCMREVGEHLTGVEDEYISRLGKAIMRWSALFAA